MKFRDKVILTLREPTTHVMPATTNMNLHNNLNVFHKNRIIELRVKYCKIFCILIEPNISLISSIIDRKCFQFFQISSFKSSVKSKLNY